MMLRVCLQFVSVVFPDHTHLLLWFPTRVSAANYKFFKQGTWVRSKPETMLSDRNKTTALEQTAAEATVGKGAT